jgi:hypothetical protein
MPLVYMRSWWRLRWLEYRLASGVNSGAHLVLIW